MAKAAASKQIHSIGRRKSSVARVWMKPGKGKLEVNGKDYKKYFDTDISRSAVTTALDVSSLSKNFDIKINVQGGGMVGQAGASRLGIARTLLKNDEELRVLFRKAGLLTVDSRNKERKKYGQKGARAKFQFVKR